MRVPFKRRATSVATPLALVALVGFLVTLLAACDRPHLHDLVPPSPTPTAIVLADPLQADLFAIDMLSASDGWAVGAQGTILHYTGGNWVAVKSPMDTYLLGVSMSSASDGWIVGASHYNGTTQAGTILHYTDGAWQMVDSPSTSYLDAVEMVSPAEGWSVGKDILHYSGGHWTKAANPDGGALSRSGIAMVGNDDGWAVSGDGFLMHYTGGQWTAWNQPDPGIKLYAVSMSNASDGWAVGEAFSGDGTPTHALLMRFHDQTWTASAGPSDQFLYGVSMVSPDEGWAVGAHGTILHYTGGQWVTAQSPTKLTLRAVRMLSPTDGWAVGVQGTILHFSRGTWTKVRG